jgi:hypothetical protein
MRIERGGIRFEPCVPKEFEKIHLSGLRYRGMRIDVTIEGNGTAIETVEINDQRAKTAHIANMKTGSQTIAIALRQ